MLVVVVEAEKPTEAAKGKVKEMQQVDRPRRGRDEEAERARHEKDPQQQTKQKKTRRKKVEEEEEEPQMSKQAKVRTLGKQEQPLPRQKMKRMKQMHLIH